MKVTVLTALLISFFDEVLYLYKKKEVHLILREIFFFFYINNNNNNKVKLCTNIKKAYPTTMNLYTNQLIIDNCIFSFRKVCITTLN